MLVEVHAPDASAVYQRAQSLAVPDGGAITILVPPVVQRLGQLLRPAIAALDAVPLTRPPSGDAQAAENAIARLRAHGVHTIVLLNARWLPPALCSELAAALTAGNVSAFAIHHPQEDDRSAFETWRSAVWEWHTFERWAAAQQLGWQAVAETAERNQRIPLPALGISKPVAIPPATSLAESRRVHRDLRARLATTQEPAAVVAQLRHVLEPIRRPFAADVLRGVAAALDDAGYALIADEGVAGGGETTAKLQWRDLRSVADTAGAAAVTLLASGHDERESAALCGSDVARDGASTQRNRRLRAIEPAGRAFVLAQRLVVGSASPLLSSPRGEPVAATVRRIGADALAELGIHMEPWATSRLRPSHRRLLEWGITVRQLRPLRPLPQQPRPADGRRWCRHGLPGYIAMGNSGVSHSQRLCGAESFEEAAPVFPGYTLEEQETNRTVQHYTVYRDALPVGSLWRIWTPRSAVWVQSMGLPAAASSEVQAAVLASQA